MPHTLYNYLTPLSDSCVLCEFCHCVNCCQCLIDGVIVDLNKRGGYPNLTDVQSMLCSSLLSTVTVEHNHSHVINDETNNMEALVYLLRAVSSFFPTG